MEIMRSRRSRQTLMASVAAIFIALFAAGCSEDASDKYVDELQHRGFENIFVQDKTQDDGRGAYNVDAGNCRLKVWYLESAGTTGTVDGLNQGFTLIEKSSQGEERDIRVDEPSLTKIRQIPAFAYCFEGEQPSTSVPTVTPTK